MILFRILPVEKTKMLTPKWFIVHIILFASVCMPSSKYHEATALIDDAIEVLKLGKEIVSTLLETWHLVEQTRDDVPGGVEFPFPKGKTKKILNRINEVSRKINTFEDDVCIQLNQLRFCYFYDLFFSFLFILLLYELRKWKKTRH